MGWLFMHSKGNKAMRPIFWEEGRLFLLDQTLLPLKVQYLHPESGEDIFQAIKALKVRGAPAIGIAGAFGVFLEADRKDDSSVADFLARMMNVGEYLKSSRPTAVNLAWAIDRVLKKLDDNADRSLLELKEMLFREAMAIRDEDERMCYQIGKHGAELLRGMSAVLTHCNAGTIATARYGTALAPIYFLFEEGVRISVFADETRPLLQGARLTAYELMEAGIEVTLITDSMAALVMAQRKVEAVIVGADRITGNGDTANKIGTYGLAILAKAHGIPFFVAAPTSTFDVSMKVGSEIPIEERGAEEISSIQGVRIAPLGVRVYNPAFDVTPASYISAIITEKGILKPPYTESIAALFASIG